MSLFPVNPAPFHTACRSLDSAQNAAATTATPVRCPHWGMPLSSFTTIAASREATEIVGHFGRDWTTGEQWHCPACIALLGYAPDEQDAATAAALEMDFADLLHPDDRAAVLHKMMTLAIGEVDTETWECRLRRAHNSGWVWVRIEAWTERGTDARPVRLTARVAVRAQMPPDSFTLFLRG